MCIKKINLNYILALKRMSLLKRLDFFSLEKIRGKKYRRDDTDKKKRWTLPIYFIYSMFIQTK